MFLDKENRVVKVVPEMKPFRVTAASGRAHCVLELPAGAVVHSQVERGDQPIIAEHR